MLHRQKGLDEVRALWRILEGEERVERRGGDLDEPAVPLPPNIAQGVRETVRRPSRSSSKTGAVVSADVNAGWRQASRRTQVDLADYYGERHRAAVRRDGGLERDHGLSGPVPTDYAAQQAARSTPTDHARASNSKDA